MQTPFTIQVGCAAPIQLAGMPGISTVELAAAVADAGGLGMLGGAMMPALALDAALGALQQITPGAVGVTFLVPFLDPEVVSVASRRSRVVDFFYGAPDAEIVRVVHARARIGTRFVASAESGAHPDYVAALLAARSGDTVLCETFSVGWPDAPHRVLRSAVAALEGLPDEPVGELRIAGTPVALPRGSVFSPTRETHGRIDAMALYAGEGVGQIRDVPPAREIVAALIRDAEALLARPR